MPKQTSRTSRTSSSKRNATKKVNSPNPGRPRPMTPKAGYTQTRRRYKDGGDWCY